MTVELPPVLLVPVVTEMEWPIKPLIEEWTEVATYDAPGVGDEQPAGARTRRAIAERGIEEIERRGWERCVVAGDEFGAVTAGLLASLAPERVAGLALGHASLSLDTEGPRRPLTAEVLDTFTSMMRTSYRTYARALSQVTQGAYDDDFADRYVERVPQDVMQDYADALYADVPEERLERTLAGLDVPLLLAEHRPCLIWTPEAFEEITRRFPGALTCTCTDKPSVSPDFVTALHDLCSAIASSGGGATPAAR
jgi:pimeloyl-ACP methyl ester carboxylesterase